MSKKIVFVGLFCLFAPCSFSLSAESGGMPQLNPEFWVSQVFWLILTFGFLFITLSKFILPKISNNLESRKSQILENVETAEKQRVESDKNYEEFLKIIDQSKVQAKNIVNEAKKKLTEDIGNKRQILESEIDKEVKSAEEEIKELIKNSDSKINQIAVETSSDLLKQIIGTEINKSNISAIVEDFSKKGKGKLSGV